MVNWVNKVKRPSSAEWIHGFKTRIERKTRRTKSLLLARKWWLRLTAAEARDVSSAPEEVEHVQPGGVLPSVLKEICELNKSLSEKIDLSSTQLQTSINGVKLRWIG